MNTNVFTPAEYCVVSKSELVLQILQERNQAILKDELLKRFLKYTYDMVSKLSE